jgi:hypothetical protein
MLRKFTSGEHTFEPLARSIQRTFITCQEILSQFFMDRESDSMGLDLYNFEVEHLVVDHLR